MKADLHCHTKLSDGSLGIEEIIQLAIKSGLDAIAITDHDCLAANTRAKIIGDRNGIKVIPGVEISATEDGQLVHILAYKCDCPDRLEGLCHKNSAARKRAGQFMMLKAASRYNISADLVMKCASGSTNLYKQHIMHALMECGYTTELYGELYEELFNPSSVDNILVVPKYAAAEKVISMIHEAGGIAILAHPPVYENKIELMEKLIEYGIEGIEVWHPSASAEIEAELIEFAKAKNLLMTGGSNFHGLYNRGSVLLGDYLTPKKHFDDLMNYKARKKRQQRKAEALAASTLTAE